VHRDIVPNDPSDGNPPRIYYAWRIELNMPEAGELRFGASDFTQTFRAEPSKAGREMRLPADARPPL